MKVLKFGGTSVGSSKSIQQVINIIQSKAKNQPIIVVVSAFGGVTNTLKDAAELAQNKNSNYLNLITDLEIHHLSIINDLIQSPKNNELIKTVKHSFSLLRDIYKGVFLIGELTNKSTAKILSYGEFLSAKIISVASNSYFKDAKDLLITNTDFINAQVNFKDTCSNLAVFYKALQQQIVIIPGFYGANAKKEITLLGRGGSDYSAAIITACLNAETLEIWTDVSGLFTANPRIVKQAKPIATISYQEAMELSHFGAKVIYPPTIQPVLQKNIPIIIKNTFSPEDVGTKIHTATPQNNKPIQGISHIGEISLISLEGSGMVGIPSMAMRLFSVLSSAKINIILITQASSEHSICIAVSDVDASYAIEQINDEFKYEIDNNLLLPCILEDELAIVAVVGDSMKNRQGISGRMFSSLGKNNINIRAIAQGASERNISTVIAHKDIKKALNTLHSTFFEKQVKQLNLFVAGVGNVGSHLLNQIKDQKEYLLKNHLLNLRVIGIANSKKVLINNEGINLKDWKNQLDKLKENHTTTLFSEIEKLNLRNSIFIDITASETISLKYAGLLSKNTAIVTCNKIACSASYASYKQLKTISKSFKAPFLYETNVGAGLPIINTLQNLISSGDQITSIHAVLSGSLNFIFNNFNESVSFSDVVKTALKDGYTEPNPKIDLSGTDVMRKILILARESGYHLELKDIRNNQFLPENCLDASSVDDFFKCLKKNEAYFNDLYLSATKENTKLKYVASLVDGKAKVGLEKIKPTHPFYNLEGKDNIVMFYTKRYSDQPLLIKGAGAGAAVTASGLFADIIKIPNL